MSVIIVFFMFTGEHGLPQPWYFPVSPYYWGCKKRKAHDMDPQSKNLATTEASRGKFREADS